MLSGHTPFPKIRPASVWTMHGCASLKGISMATVLSENYNFYPFFCQLSSILWCIESCRLLCSMYCHWQCSTCRLTSISSFFSSFLRININFTLSITMSCRDIADTNEYKLVYILMSAWIFHLRLAKQQTIKNELRVSFISKQYRYLRGWIVYSIDVKLLFLRSRRCFILWYPSYLRERDPENHDSEMAHGQKSCFVCVLIEWVFQECIRVIYSSDWTALGRYHLIGRACSDESAHLNLYFTCYLVRLHVKSLIQILLSPKRLWDRSIMSITSAIIAMWSPSWLFFIKCSRFDLDREYFVERCLAQTGLMCRGV